MLRAIILATCMAGPALAQAASSATRTEISHLLEAVASSQCQFNRNGSWHDAKSASAHLKNKFDYLDKRNQVPNTESFIANAATRSSVSGEAYQIRCPGEKVVSSAGWFTAALAKFRQTKGTL